MSKDLKGEEKRMIDDKQEIINKAMDEASKVLGADPAYFGEEGTEEVERQLMKMGYSLLHFKDK